MVNDGRIDLIPSKQQRRRCSVTDDEGRAAGVLVPPDSDSSLQFRSGTLTKLPDRISVSTSVKAFPNKRKNDS